MTYATKGPLPMKISLLAAGAVALTIAAVAEPASAADKLRVGNPSSTAFSFIPMSIGMEKGFFAKRNLEIEYSSFAGSAKIQQAMIADAIDVAVSAGPEFPFLVKAYAVGKPYAVGIAAMAGPPLLLGVGVAKDSPIASAKDLKGKKVSVSTAGGLTDWLPKELARQQGWDPESIQTVPVGEPSAQVMAMKTKQVDGMITGLSQIWDLQEKGEAKAPVVKFGEIVPDFIMHVIYATKNIEEKNPDALKRFMEGWFETIRFMRANKEETVNMGVAPMRVPKHIVERSYDEMMAMFSDTGKFEPKAVDVLARSFVELGMLDTKPDLTKYYTEKYLPGTPATH
jgi:NitT/TauT family transport system substrate-binding protein